MSELRTCEACGELVCVDASWCNCPECDLPVVTPTGKPIKVSDETRAYLDNLATAASKFMSDNIK